MNRSLVIGVISLSGVVATCRENPRPEDRSQAFARALTDYQAALPAGTSRREAENYLRRRGVSFHETDLEDDHSDDILVWDYIVLLGEAPSEGCACGPHDVYIGLDFQREKDTQVDGHSPMALDSDALREVVLYRDYHTCM